MIYELFFLLFIIKEMDKYYEFYCTHYMRSIEEEFEKKQKYFYIPSRYKDMDLVLKTDRFFKEIINKAAKVAKVNKRFIGNHWSKH